MSVKYEMCEASDAAISVETGWRFQASPPSTC
jgi:hypothetical protein